MSPDNDGMSIRNIAPTIPALVGDLVAGAESCAEDVKPAHLEGLGVELGSRSWGQLGGVPFQSLAAKTEV